MNSGIKDAVMDSVLGRDSPSHAKEALILDRLLDPRPTTASSTIREKWPILRTAVMWNLSTSDTCSTLPRLGPAAFITDASDAAIPLVFNSGNKSFYRPGRCGSQAERRVYIDLGMRTFQSSLCYMLQVNRHSPAYWMFGTSWAGPKGSRRLI